MRYNREPGSEKAEYAALVEDLWHDYGIGIALTRELIEVAWGKGIRSFYAMVMGKNTRMLRLLRHLNLPEKERKEYGIKSVEVKLSSEEE